MKALTSLSRERSRQTPSFFREAIGLATLRTPAPGGWKTGSKASSIPNVPWSFWTLGLEMQVQSWPFSSNRVCKFWTQWLDLNFTKRLPSSANYSLSLPLSFVLAPLMPRPPSPLPDGVLSQGSCPWGQGREGEAPIPPANHSSGPSLHHTDSKSEINQHPPA